MPRETQGEWKEAGAWLPANAAPVLGWAAQMRETVFPGPLTLSKRLRPPRQRQGQQRLAPGSSGWVLTARAGSTRGEAEDEPGRGHTAQETAWGAGHEEAPPSGVLVPKAASPWRAFSLGPVLSPGCRPFTPSRPLYAWQGRNFGGHPGCRSLKSNGHLPKCCGLGSPIPGEVVEH